MKNEQLDDTEKQIAIENYARIVFKFYLEAREDGYIYLPKKEYVGKGEKV